MTAGIALLLHFCTRIQDVFRGEIRHFVIYAHAVGHEFSAEKTQESYGQ
jgi:hypothetical protein